MIHEHYIIGKFPGARPADGGGVLRTKKLFHRKRSNIRGTIIILEFFEFDPSFPHRDILRYRKDKPRYSATYHLTGPRVPFLLPGNSISPSVTHQDHRSREGWDFVGLFAFLACDGVPQSMGTIEGFPVCDLVSVTSIIISLRGITMTMILYR